MNYLMLNLKRFSETTSQLLEPVDDIYGNYLEILFCRLVRCTHREQETRLRRLFFESIVLKCGKMTCSANMLNLFLTNDQYVHDKLVNKYFPDRLADDLFPLRFPNHLFETISY